MKRLFFTFLAFCPLGLLAQTWHSIPETDTYGRAAYGQFIIDPYTNNIWLNGEDHVAVIENDGTIRKFTQQSGEINGLWTLNDLQFTFNPGHVYYVHPDYGLFLFDNYTAQLEFNLTSYPDAFRNVSSNEDTVYIGLQPPGIDLSYGYKMYTPMNTIFSDHFAEKILAKDTVKYALQSNSFIYYFTGPNNGDLTYIVGPGSNDDPEYLGGTFHEVKFSRNTDTLHICTDNGISICHNYDIFDSITPNNTLDMPSANVLEIEFDVADMLWAVFGDSQDKPFAIAKLDGNSWVSRFDNSNSPIDFSTFYGLEIDTLGNLWVNDEDYLHTLMTPNSPQWLDVEEVNNTEFKVYPNPSSGEISIQLEKGVGASAIEMLDLNGRLINSIPFSNSVTLECEAGVYLIRLKDGNEVIATERLVIIH